MAVKDCARIEVDSLGREFVAVVMVVDESDYVWIGEIWPMFFPGCRIQWVDELVVDPSTPDGPVATGWIKNSSDMWFDPNYIQPEPQGK